MSTHGELEGLVVLSNLFSGLDRDFELSADADIKQDHSKIAMVRIDKIGDLVVTLPSDQLFFETKTSVTWIISQGLSTICKRAVPQRAFFELNPLSPFNSALKLYTFIRKNNFDKVIFFYGPFWVAFVLWLSGPEVVLRKSQWWSFLLFKNGLRQKRSQPQKHELEYNIDLVTYANKIWSRIKSKNETLPQNEILIKVNPSDQGGALSRDLSGLRLQPIPARQWLEQLGLQTQNYFIVHPGMRGSALNWTIDNYIKTISELKKSQPVIVTGTGNDSLWLNPIEKKFHADPNVIVLKNKLNLDELLYMLKNSYSVLAPSTGVAHLAAAVGARLVALYPERVAQSATRWRPLGRPNYVRVLTSPAEGLLTAQVDEVVKQMRNGD